MLENKPLSVPHAKFSSEILFDGSALDTNDGSKNSFTATNVTYSNTDAGYQKQHGQFNGSTSEVTTAASLS